jgi:hypothetical protein
MATRVSTAALCRIGQNRDRVQFSSQGLEVQVLKPEPRATRLAAKEAKITK